MMKKVANITDQPTSSLSSASFRMRPIHKTCVSLIASYLKCGLCLAAVRLGMPPATEPPILALPFFVRLPEAASAFLLSSFSIPLRLVNLFKQGTDAKNTLVS